MEAEKNDFVTLLKDIALVYEIVKLLVFIVNLHLKVSISINNSGTKEWANG